MTMKVNGPNGVVVNFPDGTDKETINRVMMEAVGRASKGQQAAPVQPQQDQNWSDLPGNIGHSAVNAAQGIWNAVTHPLDTGVALADIAAGGVTRGLNRVLPESMQITPKNANEQRMLDRADAFGAAMKDRYGGLENIKRTAINDPVGALMDASAIATAGGGALARAPLAASQTVGRGLLAAGEITNPLNVVTKPVGLLASGIENARGGSALAEAYRAGRAGGKQSAALADNMRGNVPQDAVLQEAQMALDNMSRQRSADYRAGMQATKANKTQMDWQPVEDAMQQVTDSLFHGPVSRTDEATLALAKKVGQKIDEFKAAYPNPTPADLDALKISINKLAPNVFNKSGDQSRVVSTMYDAVKNQILAADPNYASTMKAYENSISGQREIEKALSLGGNASKDTSLRKLQSVMRNNANTNYGSRVDNVKALEAAGADTIMPALAGQQLNSWMPRGLMKYAVSAPAAYSLVTNPASWPLVAAGLIGTSPRIMGEAALLGGKVAGKTGRAAKKLGVNKKNAVRAGIIGRDAQERGLLAQ